MLAPEGVLAVDGPVPLVEHSDKNYSEPLGMCEMAGLAAICPCKPPLLLLWNSTPALPGVIDHACGNMSRMTGGFAEMLFQSLHC